METVRFSHVVYSLLGSRIYPSHLVLDSPGPLFLDWSLLSLSQTWSLSVVRAPATSKHPTASHAPSHPDSLPSSDAPVTTSVALVTSSVEPCYYDVLRRLRDPGTTRDPEERALPMRVCVLR